jgi:hypothetical protein
MSFIFALLVSDDSLLTASNDCIVVRQSEPRIRNTPAAAPRQYGLFEPVAAHFRLILRAYDLVHRRTVLSFLTHPDRTPQPWRRSGAISEASHSRLEHIMFANFAKRLGALFVNTEELQRDTYLASSTDFVDLEHRMYVVETAHYPFTLYSASAPHEWKV